HCVCDVDAQRVDECTDSGDYALDRILRGFGSAARKTGQVGCDYVKDFSERGKLRHPVAASPQETVLHDEGRSVAMPPVMEHPGFLLLSSPSCDPTRLDGRTREVAAEVGPR